ncbi:hypothetical protein [Stieleria marina]
MLGSTVACQHCQAEFIANGMEGEKSQVDENCRLMARVEKALQKSSAQSASTTIA